MSKKKYIEFIILAVVFFGTVFYWYSLRPSIIKKDCHKEAKEKIIEKLKQDNTEGGGYFSIEAMEKRNRVENYFFEDDFNTYYRWCLQKKGL